jgi:Geranylgeranyl pyrophosphate synthase
MSKLFEARLEEFVEKINDKMEEYVPAGKESGLTETLFSSIRYSLLNGGKRLRPVLALAFCELCGGKAETAMAVACAVEMIHTYSLIHDDLPCMDNDTIRRGLPCNHIEYGENIALLAGDALLTKAFEIIVKDKNLTPEQKVKSIEILSKTAGADGMVGGQCIDLMYEGQQADMSILQKMDEGKTVAIIEAACLMGCVAAGASEDREKLKAAKIFAYYLGMAFQIRDDILGETGDVALLGKTVGLDTEREKSNYVSLLGIDKAQELVKEYTDKTLEAFAAFDGDSQFLKSLALSLTDRNS